MSMGYREDLHCAPFFPVNDCKWEALKHELSGSVLADWPRLRSVR